MAEGTVLAEPARSPTVQRISTKCNQPTPANCKPLWLWALGLWGLEHLARHPSPGDGVSPREVNVDGGSRARVQVQVSGARFHLRPHG
jgi:hypothetical protein